MSLQWSLNEGRIDETRVTDVVSGYAGATEAGVASGHAGAAAAGGGSASAGSLTPTLQTIVIEFSGYRGGLEGLRGLNGVVAAEPGRARVRAAESDDALRWLLAADGGVHIERVATVDADGSGGRVTAETDGEAG